MIPWFEVISVIAVAIIGSLFTRSSIQSGWYRSLNKPQGTPPSNVFPIVWTALYIMMIVAYWLAVKDTPDNNHEVRNLFWVQLLLNLAWSLVFFGLLSTQWAILVIVLLLTTIIALAWWYWSHGYRLSFYLTIPYILWVGYATYLNIGIVQANKGV